MPKKIKTKAKIRTDEKKDYLPTDPPGYFYMFTGGYKLKDGTLDPDPVGPDDGPAGNVAFEHATGSWRINLVDTTGEKFKIVRWTLKTPNALGLTFNPAPDTELDPTGKLEIDVDDVPAGHHMEFEKFGIFVENEDGDRVELDPRLYDIR